tara:strand:+ start:14654 stop:15073 length:420 start_codon:yes stop_codon:yes gene_type:complete
MSVDLYSALSAASTGLRAQTVRIRLAAENVANANSTSEVPGGDPYQRRMPVFRAMVDQETGAKGVQVVRAAADESDFPVKYDPTHPAADENGYVKLPNVKTLIEMADIREAQRTYEANLNIIESSRSMINRALDLLRRG